MSSLRWRFIIIYLCVIAVAFLAVTAIAVRIVEKNLIEQRVSERMIQVSNLSVSIGSEFYKTDTDSLYDLIIDGGRELSGRVLVLNEAGVVQADSFSRLNGTAVYAQEVADVLTNAQDSSYGFHSTENENGESFWTVYYVSAVVHNGDTIGALLVSESIQDVVNEANTIKTRFIIIYAITCLLIIAATFLLTNHITKPLNSLRNAAIQMSGGDFKQVDIHGSDEIAELGEAFNTMSTKLKNVDQNRSEFVSNASHELKTPLTSMKILVESILYQNGIEESVYKEFLGDINEEIDRLTNLINDLLFMTKLEDDTAMLNTENISFTRLINNTADMLRPIAAAKDVELEVIINDDIFIECDELKIAQAINNLAENAIKYTNPGGHVELFVYLEDGFAKLSVKDNGVGISSEDIPHIFDRFYRVDKARSRETGGTGLGLHIVKRIALLHGGTVSVKSVLGEGSVFTLSIPTCTAKENKE